MQTIICGKDCDDCKYASFNEKDKARVIVHCAARNRNYYYGQSVQCDDKERKEE